MRSEERGKEWCRSLESKREQRTLKMAVRLLLQPFCKQRTSGGRKEVGEGRRDEAAPCIRGRGTSWRGQRGVMCVYMRSGVCS